MTTEKTEEQIAKEKESVAAMRHAMANMRGALDRILTLQRALEAAKNRLATLRKYAGEDAYIYNSTTSVRSLFDAAIAECDKALTGD